MSDSRRCDGCAHWTQRVKAFAPDGYFFGCALPSGLGAGYRTEPDDSGLCTKGTMGRDYGPAEPTTEMWANDGSDYKAIVITRPGFYCKMHEAKSGEDMRRKGT